MVYARRGAKNVSYVESAQPKINYTVTMTFPAKTSIPSQETVDTEEPVKSFIEKILPDPLPFKRSTKHRKYRMPNSGVQTGDEMMAMRQKIIEEKEAEEAVKSQRKVMRDQKQEIAQTIRNIKKEKADQKKKLKQDKAEETLKENVVPKKKRGRPPKRPAVDDLGHDSNWSPQILIKMFLKTQ